MNLFDLCVKISIDTSEADTGIAKVSQSGEKASKSLGSKLVSAGKTAAKGLAVVSGAATAVVGGLLAVESSTEEYRIAQGKLNTAFEAAGMGANVAQQAYKSFYGILGDTDTATEASQLLAELALNEQDVTTWTNIAAGVFGRWGDSIPIEGLIEASNETAKVGQVTGVLADALNWAGISEDEFNKKLASCSSESERNKMIMEALSGEYGEAAKAFYENNEALVSSRYASNDVTDAMSKIGKAVSEVKTKFLNELVPALASAAPQIANAISSIDVSSLVNGFSDFFSEKFTEARDASESAWDNITTFFSGVWEDIKGVFSRAWDEFKNIWFRTFCYFLNFLCQGGFRDAKDYDCRRRSRHAGGAGSLAGK